MWSSRIDTVDLGSVFLVEENSMEVSFRLEGEEGMQGSGKPQERCACRETTLKRSKSKLKIRSCNRCQSRMPSAP